MKQKLLTTLSNKVMITAIAACSLAAIIISSCTKSNSNSSPDYAPQFVGTWTTTSATCGSAGGTFSFSSNSINSLSLPGTVGKFILFKVYH